MDRFECVEEEEEMKVDVSPSWVQTPSDPAAPYAYAGRYPYTPDYPILDAAPLYDRTDVESQDSGIEGSRAEEINIKEHGVEGCAPKDRPSNISSRDPKRRRVMIAGPSRLYGGSSTPMIDPQNIANTGPASDSDGDDKLVIVLGDE